MPKSASGSSQSSSRQVARLEFQRSSSRSPSPNRRQSAENSTHLTDEQLFTGGIVEGGREDGREGGREGKEREGKGKVEEEGGKVGVEGGKEWRGAE